MTPLIVAKAVVGSIASIGASTIVGTIIKNNVPTPKLTTKVTVWVGGTIISMIVADAVKNYTYDAIDGLVESYDSAKVESN